MTQAWIPNWRLDEIKRKAEEEDVVLSLNGEEIKPPKWPSIGHSDDLTL